MGSRLCNTAGDKLSVTPFTFPNPGCLSFSFYPTTNPGSNVYLFIANDTSTPGAQQVFSIFRRSSDGIIRAGFFREGVANREFGNTGWTLNAWNTVFLIWGQSPQQMELLINGSDAGARSDWEDAYWDTAGADYITFGSVDGGGVSTCRMAQIHLWDAQDVLRQNNGRPIAAELYNGVDPDEIFPQNRVAYWPVQGLYSPEPDYSDNQRHLTVTGTSFVDEGPPLITGAPQSFLLESNIVVRRGGLMPAFLGPIPGFGAG